MSSTNIEQLVERVDPRNWPSTREFFARLHPEVAERIAEFYRTYARTVFEAADLMAKGLRIYEEQAGASPEVHDRLYDSVVGGMYSGGFPGRQEIEADLAGLHWYEDDGMSTQIDHAVIETALGFFPAPEQAPIKEDVDA